MEDKNPIPEHLYINDELHMLRDSKYVAVRITESMKRSLSESENEFKVKDESELFHHCDTYNNKKRICYKDIESNSFDKRSNLKSISESIKNLTKKIEHIENNVLFYNTENTEKNKTNDDELLDQHATKKFKFDDKENTNANCSRDSKNLICKKIELFNSSNTSGDIIELDNINVCSAKICNNNTLNVIISDDECINLKNNFSNIPDVIINTNVYSIRICDDSTSNDECRDSENLVGLKKELFKSSKTSSYIIELDDINVSSTKMCDNSSSNNNHIILDDKRRDSKNSICENKELSKSSKTSHNIIELDNLNVCLTNFCDNYTSNDVVLNDECRDSENLVCLKKELFKSLNSDNIELDNMKVCSTKMCDNSSSNDIIILDDKCQDSKNLICQNNELSKSSNISHNIIELDNINVCSTKFCDNNTSNDVIILDDEEYIHKSKISNYSISNDVIILDEEGYKRIDKINNTVTEEVIISDNEDYDYTDKIDSQVFKINTKSVDCVNEEKVISSKQVNTEADMVLMDDNKFSLPVINENVSCERSNFKIQLENSKPLSCDFEIYSGYVGEICVESTNSEDNVVKSGIEKITVYQTSENSVSNFKSEDFLEPGYHETIVNNDDYSTCTNILDNICEKSSGGSADNEKVTLLLDSSKSKVSENVALENDKDKISERNNKSLLSSPLRYNTSIDGTDHQNHSSESNRPEIHSTIDFQKCLSPDSSYVEQDHYNSQSSDDSLLFMPSKEDLLKYIKDSSDEYEENNELILSLNKSLCNNLSQKTVSKSKSCLKPSGSQFTLNPVSNKAGVHDLKSSSFAKDYEDKVQDFYDCDLSSIENSDFEDDFFLPLSFETDSSLDNSLFNEKSEMINDSIPGDHTICHENSNVLSSKSKLDNTCTLTAIVKSNNSFIRSSYDHQYMKIIARDSSKDEFQFNRSVVCSLENCDQPLMTNKIDKELSSDQINLHEGSNLSKTTLLYVAPCTAEKSLKMLDIDVNKMPSNSSVIDYDDGKVKPCEELIDQKPCLDNVDKKPGTKGLDFEGDSVLPHISQFLAKTSCWQSLKKAFAHKATANTNMSAMGDQALNTYLTQQSMTINVLKDLHKSLETCPSSGILLDDPKGLVVPLMPHQKHAIAWLMWREQQEPSGGILADDMGLGKTLSMISLILKTAEEKQNGMPGAVVKNTNNNLINGGTLIVCPASLISQWENEVRTKLKPSLLKIGQYYGINRNMTAKELAKYDLVTTSYHIIMWEYKKHEKSSPLFKVHWDRIILDEAHFIRNHKTQTSFAVCNMSSFNRWAITGTPIHNTEADFFTLLKFVRCKPFDDWPVWKRWVSNNDDLGKSRLALLVKTLMLRRTKEELSQLTTFKLPSKNVHTIEIELSKEERNAYEKLLQFSSNLFATYLYEKATKENLLNNSIEVQCKVQYFQEKSKGKEEVFKDYPELLKLFKQFKNIVELQTYHILVLLLRLRQICCHPCLIKGRISKETMKEETIKKEAVLENNSDTDNDGTDTDETDNDPCNVNVTTAPVLGSTTALVSDSSDVENLTELMSCLTLKEEPKKEKTIPIDSNMIFNKFWLSSKIKAVCDLVWEKVLKNNGKDKAIIVSQWPSMLYLIREKLSRFNVEMEMYSGSVTVLKRNKIIRKFNNPNEGPQILLLSLNAGGVGLNLTVANHMFMVDVHWNPQLEAQAYDRIYRVGQAKPVNFYKFICLNTIETQILMIQSHKLQIANNLFKGVGNNSSKITLDDLKQIFQMN